MLVDTHTHLLDERLLPRVDKIISNFEKDGLVFAVEVGTGFDDSKNALELANKYQRLFCTIGVHPHYAGEYSDEFEEWAKQVVQKERKIIGVGECGLDYHYDFSPRDVQRETFIRQIKLADTLGLPLVVHSRDAFEDTIQVLTQYKELLKNGLLLHCFGYGASEAKKFTGLDAYFAFGGAITYRDMEMYASALKTVPLDRIVLETDCPYLVPCPIRNGKSEDARVNQPKNIKAVAEYISKILNMDYTQVCKITTENAKRLFKIDAASVRLLT